MAGDVTVVLAGLAAVLFVTFCLVVAFAAGLAVVGRVVVLEGLVVVVGVTVRLEVEEEVAGLAVVVFVV